jgi:hypothetical protein
VSCRLGVIAHEVGYLFELVAHEDLCEGLEFPVVDLF